jgi:hypothetical protein
MTTPIFEDTGNTTWTYQGTNFNQLTINGKTLSYYKDQSPAVNSVYNWSALCQLFDNLSSVVNAPLHNILKIQDTLRIIDSVGNTIDITPTNNTATAVNTTTSDELNQNYYIAFTKRTAGIGRTLYVDDTTSPLTYNPSTGTLTAINFNGTASLVNVLGNNQNQEWPVPFCTGGPGSRSLICDSPHLMTFNPGLDRLTVPNISTALLNVTDGTNNTNITPTNISTTTFTGSLTRTATNANNINVGTNNATGTWYPVFVGGTGYQTAYVDPTTTSLTYTPSSSNLSATSFTGSLIGNADSASNATAVTTVSDNTNTTCYVPFTKSTAGSGQILYVDDTTTPLTYNPSSSVLSCQNFTGSSVVVTARLQLPNTLVAGTFATGTLTLTNFTNATSVTL